MASGQRFITDLTLPADICQALTGFLACADHSMTMLTRCAVAVSGRAVPVSLRGR